MSEDPQNGRAFHRLLCLGSLLFVGLALLLTRYSVRAQTIDPTPTPPYIPGPVLDSITNPYQRQVSPSPLIIGQDATAEIGLTGNSNPACFGIPGKPVDVMLVYDISASAGIGPGSNWEATSLLTQSLVDHMGRPIYQTPMGTPSLSRIGLITSRIGTLGVEPDLIQPLTEDFTLLRNQVAAITPGDDTNLAAGLQMAGEELAKVQTPDREQAIVLMLHDNAGFLEMEEAVAELSAQGIPIYLIINNLNIKPGSQLDRTTAEALTDDENIFIDPTPEELHDLFLSATDGDEDAAAAAIQVIEELTPAGSAQIFNVSGTGGRIESSRVVWDIPQLDFGDALNLEYGFRLPGSDAVGISGGMVWLDCNGYPHSTVTGIPVGMAAIVEITATPETISAQPESQPESPTETPIAVVTATATPGVVVPPGPGSGSTPPNPNPDLPDGGLFGGFSWWWLLLIPILLLLLWLLWRWWQGGKPAPTPTSRPISKPERPSVEGRKITRVGPPTGEDVAHGWTTETLKDKYGRSLTLRYQPATNEQDRSQMTVRVDDEKGQPVGRAVVFLQNVVTQDKHTGQKAETIRARLQEWQLQDPRDYRKGVGTQLFARLEQWSIEQQAVDFVVPAGMVDDANLLTTQEYKAQGSEWVKPLTNEGG